MDRPIWRGFISFGLVSIPVILFSAEKKSDIHFKLIDSRNSAKIHYKRVNEQTGEEVPWEDVAKGYEYSDGNYILLNEKELKNMTENLSKIINIENFVNINALDYIDFDKPYYLVPDKYGEKGYVILRECLKQTKKVGITKVVIHSRQYLAALVPYENALILNLLRYHQQIKKPSEFDLPAADAKKYKVTSKELEMAKQLVNSMSSAWKPETYQDEFKMTLERWLEEEIQHVKHKSPKKHPGISYSKKNVIDFSDLLKKSIKSKMKSTNIKKVSDKRSKK